MEPSKKTRIRSSDTETALHNTEEISMEKVQIMKYHFVLNIFGLEPPKYATPFVRSLYKVFITGIYTLFMLALLGQLLAVYVHWGDIPVFSITVSHMSGLILASVTCAYYLKSRDKFAHLIDLLRTQFVNKMHSKYVEFIHIAERQVSVSVILTVAVCSNCSAIWLVTPYFKLYNFKRNNGTAGGNDFERLIFVMWAPFEMYQSPQFEIIMMLQTIASSFSGFTLFAIDNVFLSLMAHAAAQFKVLCAMLNDMHQNIAESDPHTTRRTSPLHLSTTDSAVTEASTRANETVCHESESGISGSYGSETARSENGQNGADAFRLYLAECIKHHQAIIG
jgi:hypothetical protein